MVRGVFVAGCSVEDCARPHFGLGFCRGHHARFKLHGDPLRGGPLRERGPSRAGKSCSVEDCIDQLYAKDYCAKHYRNFNACGDPLGKRYLETPSYKLECTVDICTDNRYAKDYCSKHYSRWLKYGDPLGGSSRTWFKDEASEGFRTCRVCLKIFPANNEHFYNAGRGKEDDWSSSCIPCSRVRLKAIAISPGHSRKHTLKRRYNITVEQYDVLLESQGGACAICGRVPVEGERRLAVDHDHACCPDGEKTCGKCIRGLLCVSCNSGVGMLSTVELLKSAQVYLERSNG